MKYFNFKDDIVNYLIAENPEFKVFNWKLIEQMYYNRYSNQITIDKNILLFIKKMRRIFFIECEIWLEKMKSINIIKNNMQDFFDNDGKNISTTINDGSNHNFTRNDPHNIDDNVFASGSKTDASNHSKQTSDSKKIDYNTRIDTLNKINEFINVNNVYKIFLDKLKNLFKYIILDSSLGIGKGDCCSNNCQPNICLGFNYPNYDEVDMLIDEKVEIVIDKKDLVGRDEVKIIVEDDLKTAIDKLDYVSDVSLILTEETDDPNTVHIEASVKVNAK